VNDTGEGQIAMSAKEQRRAQVLNRVLAGAWTRAQAAAAGAIEHPIMNQTGHRSVPMVRKYIRDGQLFRDNAAATVGL